VKKPNASSKTRKKGGPVDLGDSGEFARRLVTLAEIFDKKLSPQSQALYFEALRDVPFADVAAAMNAALKACTFMPKPAELRKLAVGDAEDLAEAAWLSFRQAMRTAGAYRSIALTDAALGETVLAMFGGWPEACRADFSAEMWSSKRKEFGRIYRVFADRVLQGARYLPGLIELENASNPAWGGYTELAVVEGPDIQLLSGVTAEAYRAEIATSRPRPQLGPGAGA
jgi:hypothetical protein